MRLRRDRSSAESEAGQKDKIMRLIGLMPFRNEAWILELAIRQALKWCDGLVLFDHASTDDGIAIIRDLNHEFYDRLYLDLQPDPLWNEMAHRQTMLDTAMSWGATHIAIIDADEILTENLVPAIRDYAARLGDRQMLQLPGFNLRGGWKYHANGTWGNRWFSTVFKVNPTAQWSGDKFHAREPAGVQWSHVRPFNHIQGGTLHFWGYNEDRLRAKHALYKVTERIRWPDKRVVDIDRLYSLAIHGNAQNRDTPIHWQYRDVPEAWRPPELYAIDEPRELWQVAEVRRIVAEHGPERFAGLDLFGIA